MQSIGKISSKTYGIAGGSTIVLTGMVRGIQATEDLRVWYGEDAGTEIATKGLLIHAYTFLEPFKVSDGSVSLHATVATDVHVLQ